MTRHAGAVRRSAPHNNTKQAGRLWQRARGTLLLAYSGLTVALPEASVIGCSTRVPVEQSSRANRTEPDGAQGAFMSRAEGGVSPLPGFDASLPQADANDVSNAGSGTVSSETPLATDTFASSDGEEPSPSTTNVDTTNATLDDTSGPSQGSTVVNPVPTRQVTVPLPNARVKFALVVSVDGLATRFLEQLIDSGLAPTFARLQKLAAWTHNARTDKTHTYTLPNHTCMLTGLPVEPIQGLEPHRAHFFVGNSDPAPDQNLHQLRFPEHTYTPSMFDVAHDNGLTTAMFASKSKFSLFSQTYNDAGGPDKVGPNDGTRKIDRVFLHYDPAWMMAELVTQLETLPPHLTFVHLNEPDGSGHSRGWGSPEYLTAVTAMDTLLGELLSVIQNGQLANRTALIVTSDHGGVDYSHLDQSVEFSYRIPFYVLAPGVAPGDLYALLEQRVAPGSENPAYDAADQPIRNGDAGNLALDLLGLEPIPDSVMHGAGLVTAL